MGQGGRPNPTVASLDWTCDGMEDVGTGIAEEVQWMVGALARAGDCNQLALGVYLCRGKAMLWRGWGYG